MRYIHGLEKYLRNLSRFMAAAGGAALLAMMVIFCANILLRPLGGGIQGTVEISGCLCAMAVALCLPAAQFKGSHIEVGVMTQGFSPLALDWQKACASLLCSLLLLLTAGELLDLAQYTYNTGEIIEGFGFSAFAMIAGMLLGISTHGLIFICFLLKALSNIRKGRAN